MINFAIKRLALALSAVTLVSAALTACIPLVIGGAAAGGTLVVTDRRTSGAQLEDEGIELRASSRLRSNIVDRAHINVTSYNRQVLLTGEVPTAQDNCRMNSASVGSSCSLAAFQAGPSMPCALVA